jgi:GT2 family glycosyltransferase
MMQTITKKAAVIISPNYQGYAKKYLPDCIQSLRGQSWQGERKIFLVDNQSTEDSCSFLKQTAPEAEIIRNEKNEGFAKGNNDAMRAALEQRFDYIILFNMDTIIETDCIRHLVKAAESDSLIGAVQARMMFWPEKDRINSLGNVTHFLGFGYCEGYGEKWFGDPSSGSPDIGYPSGAAVLFKKEILERIGLFDEKYWMYNEDQDLGWRIWLSGLRCVLAPQAVVYHKYEFCQRIQRYYWMDRNRILSIIKNYQISTIILISFAFVIMELGQLFFVLQRGLLREKLQVYKYFFSPGNWRTILRNRRESQALRKVADRDILHIFSGRIWYEEIGGWGLKVFNFIFGYYWRVMKLFIRNLG